VSLRAAQLPRVRGHTVPRLAEVVDLVGDRGRLVVELKTPHWSAGAADSTVAAVMVELQRHRLHDVVVSSFDRPRLLRVHGYAAPVRTALLGRPGVPLAVLLRRAGQDRHQEVHAHISSLLGRLELVRPAVQQGISVSGWTVNQPSELARLRDAGVAAAICDDPGLARTGLQGRSLAAAV
jgi:glycerophosphoryl diester phosphodiesterase